MTDHLTKLTDEEVRVRVALALGWTDIKLEEIEWGINESGDRYTGRQPDMIGACACEIPDVIDDLNAAFTLVEKLRGEWQCDIFCTPGSHWKVVFSKLTNIRDLEEYAHEDPSLCRAICIPFLAVTEREEG